MKKSKLNSIKNTFIPLLGIILLFPQIGKTQESAPDYEWAISAGGPGVDYGRGISVDSQGYSYVVGDFTGTAIFGSTSLTSEGGSRDIFIAKLDENGNYIWTISIGNTGEEQVFEISTDAQGSSYITGRFEETVIFGNTTLISNGSPDIFIAKLDTNGNFVWAKSAGSS